MPSAVVVECTSTLLAKKTRPGRVPLVLLLLLTLMLLAMSGSKIIRTTRMRHGAAWAGPSPPSSVTSVALSTW